MLSTTQVATFQCRCWSCNCALCSHFQPGGREWLGRGGSLYKMDEFWKYSKRSLLFSDWCLVFRSLLLLGIEYWVLLNIYKISIGDSCQFFPSRLLLLKASNFQRKSWQTTFSSFLRMKRNDKTENKYLLQCCHTE